MKRLTIFLSFIFYWPALANMSTTHHIAISQGISSPTSNSTVNYSHGWTHENPVGVIYQTSLRLSGQYDTGDGSNGNENSGYGGELGMGSGRYGFAVGYYQRDCDNCDGDVAGAVGLSFGKAALGLRFEEETYSVGLLFNPEGQHRLGLIAELNDPEGEGNNVQAVGAGYTYMGSKFRFALDASKRDYENDNLNDDEILLTPALSLHFQKLAFSVSYDVVLEEQDSNNDNEDNLWWGLGFGNSRSWNLAFYADYVNEWSLVGTIFF